MPTLKLPNWLRLTSQRIATTDQRPAPPNTWSLPHRRIPISSDNESELTNRESISAYKLPLRSIISSFLILAFVGAFTMAWRWSTPQYIVCRTQLGDCWPELDTRVAAFANHPLLIAWRELKLSLPQSFKGIQSVSLAFSLNRQLTVSLLVDEPVVQITSPSLRPYDYFYGVGYSGNVLHKTKINNLPSIALTSLQSLPGDTLPASQIAAIQIVYNLSSLGYQVVANQTESDIMTATINGSRQARAIFPLDGKSTPEQLVSTLQVILTQTKINDKQAQIDLRFSKPVIRMSDAASL